MIMAKTIFVFSRNAKASEFFQSLTLVLIRCKLTNQLALLHWETFFLKCCCSSLQHFRQLPRHFMSRHTWMGLSKYSLEERDHNLSW